eukprot:CAMPEP_0171078900 /NCGR_PEP_ID=MMETSP0766_2-20121228/14919_1 /TAXON_ID=439317 /ORGANISM="Gambierdiscus australes, Strain CAWD 149" /LENGTH=777 /DNA_ID=CAMNT_0011536055 /DNA_START=151 /DNA_END=2484 /DNA_ORIENTATION=-
MTFLDKVKLFRQLPQDQHPILARACEPRSYDAGQVIIKQGDRGDSFFVIRSGEAQVLIAENGEEPREVMLLSSGEFFGEKALLRNEPRSATVKALTPISTLMITREKFQELHLHERLVFHRRQAVAASSSKPAARPPSKKTAEEKKLIGLALQQNERLQGVVSLNPERIRELVAVAWKEKVAEGQELIREGNLKADYFYIVQYGSFEVLQEKNEGTERRSSLKVANVTSGGSFGESALLYSAPRSATVKASEDSLVWVIDRHNFKEILMKVSDAKLSQYVRYLHRCRLLRGLSKEQKRAIAKAMVEAHFRKDEVITLQGEEGNTFYVMYEGEVAVSVDGVEKARLVASTLRRTTHPFGERALLTNEPRAATVRAVSGTVMTLALDRESFNLLLGPLEDILKRGEQNRSSCLPCWSWCGTSSRRRRGVTRSRASMSRQLYASYTKELDVPMGIMSGQVSRKDLRKVGLLGCGGFGAVELWEHPTTGTSYAMKALSKGYIVQMGMQESVMTEKFILQMTNSAFIIALYETYNGTEHLYFLLEPALGGELHATYNRKGLHGSVKHAKYYTGGVVFAFDHLHERRIIYRDLKPENLMLNDKGHLKVTDMGLSKFVIGKTFTTCGTPDYFAPELLASVGHSNAVDWWTLGILIFELMTGHPPFESETHMQIFSKVMKGIVKVKFPPNIHGALADLIKCMLQKEPSMRLPMRPGGSQNLKDHAWFADFDWAALQALTMTPPYLPTVKNRTDLANFKASKEEYPPQVQYIDDGSGWDKDFATGD